MKLENIHNILIVGAGTMGQQIALQCAMHNFTVKLYDIKAEALATAQARIEVYAQDIAANGWRTAGEMQDALARISTTTDPAEAAAGAHLLSESIPENPALKGKVFAQFNLLCPAETIFTTNTSSLVPSMIAMTTGRPERFAAMHFHTTVWISNVMDVMPHPGTAPEIVEILEGFGRRIGQIPIVLKKENHGYVFNAMLNALNTAAITLAANDVATPEDIDRAWMGVMKMPIGPMSILDGVGLDTVWKITNYWAGVTRDPQLQANADYLKENFIDQGKLGVKSGQGFYTYPNPAYTKTDFLPKP